jgi:hypothetical protein
MNLSDAGHTAFDKFSKHPHPKNGFEIILKGDKLLEQPKLLRYSNQIAFRFLCLFFLPTTSLKNIVGTCYNAAFCFAVNKNNFA